MSYSEVIDICFKIHTKHINMLWAGRRSFEPHTLSAVWLTTVRETEVAQMYEGWNFNSGNYLFTTDTK